MPLETETFPCGQCGKPVETEWCSDGLLPGPYALLGDVVFHDPECVNEYLKDFNDTQDTVRVVSDHTACSVGLQQDTSDT